MDLEEDVVAAYQKWYESLDKDSSGLPDWGPVCTGLSILERLIESYDLDIDHHRTSNGAQIRRQGLPLANKILSKFHVSQKLSYGEFGRTNRSSVPTAEKLLVILKPLHLENLPQDERNQILTRLQANLLPLLLKNLSNFQVEANYTPAIATERFIKIALSKGTSKTSGAIAQHLVGAKLELRFPDIDISKHSASTADAPTDRSGDFVIGDTIFHVTMAPQELIYLKCQRNLIAGYRVYLLVPEEKLQATIKKAREKELEIVVKSIESFIGQNIDELGQFSTQLLKQQIKELISIYNRRRQVERLAPEIRIEETVSREGDTLTIKMTIDDEAITQ